MVKGGRGEVTFITINTLNTRCVHLILDAYFRIKTLFNDFNVFLSDLIQIEYFKGFYVLLNIQWNTLTPRAVLIKTSKLPIKRRKTKRCVKTVIKRFGTRTN